jgi:hypothetical protein
MKSIGRLRVCPIVIGIALVTTINACTAFDPLDSTGETLNRNTTDYSNDAILMNIVRSKLYEPLSFIAITGITGVSSATGTLGFGGFTLGPAKPPPTFLLGPATASRTNSNSFNVSVIDDPASFAALLAPINPAVIGFFINQGYPRELLFFLLTNRLRKVEKDETGKITQVVREYTNNPDDEAQFLDFVGAMATLLRWGLTAEIDITATPAGRALPLSKLCMDPSLPLPDFASGAGPGPPRPANASGLCQNAPWIETQNAAPPSPSPGKNSGGENSSAKGATANSSKPSSAALAAFEFDDGYGHHYQLFTRSTFGAYNYVGAILRTNHDIDNLQPDDQKYRGIVRIVNSDRDCFAAVGYRNVNYCVPADANNTKKLFALLHQLQQLNTAPSNTPTTLTIVPG